MLHALLALPLVAGGSGQDPFWPMHRALLADGKRAAVPHEDGTVRLFELATGKTEAVLSGHEGEVRAVVPSPDGGTLATCGADGTLRLWDLVDHSGRAVIELPDSLHPLWGSTLTFSPSGEHLVAVAEGRWARVWDVASGKALFTLPEESKTTDACWTPEGGLLSVGLDGLLQLWDPERGRPLRDPVDTGTRLNVVACHPDGNHVATASQDDTISLWSLETGKRIERAQPVSDPFGPCINQLVFTAEGEDLLVASGGIWRVDLLDAATLERRWHFDNGGGSSAAMRVTLDHSGRYVGYTCTSRIVRRKDGETVPTPSGMLGPFLWTRDDRFVICGRRSQTCVLDGETFEVIYRRAELPDGEFRITSGDD